MLSRNLANRINHAIVVTKVIMLFVIAVGGMSKYNDTENWKTPLQYDSNNPAIYSYPIAITAILFSYNGWNNLSPFSI